MRCLLADAPVMGTVVEVINFVSIGLSVAIAGAGIGVIIFVWRAGFVVARRVFTRILRSIGRDAPDSWSGAATARRRRERREIVGEPEDYMSPAQRRRWSGWN